MRLIAIVLVLGSGSLVHAANLEHPENLSGKRVSAPSSEIRLVRSTAGDGTFSFAESPNFRIYWSTDESALRRSRNVANAWRPLRSKRGSARSAILPGRRNATSWCIPRRRGMCKQWVRGASRLPAVPRFGSRRGESWSGAFDLRARLRRLEERNAAARIDRCGLGRSLLSLSHRTVGRRGDCHAGRDA